MFYQDKICIGHLVLVCSIIVSTVFFYWLYSDTDMEIFINHIKKEKRFLLYEQYEDDIKLRAETLERIADDEVHIRWLPFVQDLPFGYAKLEMYQALLQGDLEREETYAEIASILDSSPEEFLVSDKVIYLNALNEVKNIRTDLLEKYDLLNSDEINNKNTQSD